MTPQIVAWVYELCEQQGCRDGQAQRWRMMAVAEKYVDLAGNRNIVFRESDNMTNTDNRQYRHLLQKIARRVMMERGYIDFKRAV